MGDAVAGDVVVVTFPFSDLSSNKRRPAVVLAAAEFDDLILCQVTSKTYSSKLAVPFTSADFSHGGLPTNSFARPDRLFTAHTAIVSGVRGHLTKEKHLELVGRVTQLIAVQ